MAVPPALARLVEEDGLAVPGDVPQERPVQQRQVPLLLLAGPRAHDPDHAVVAGHQRAAVARDVLDRQLARGPREQPLAAARHRDRPDRSRHAHARGREPDLAGVAPGQAVGGDPALGVRHRAGPGAVDAHDLAAVVALGGVVEEGDPLAVGRDADVAEPARRLEERRPHRVLDPALPGDPADDGEARALGPPVGPLHVLEDLPRRPAEQRRLGHDPRPDEAPRPVAVEREGHLARRGDGEDLRLRQREGARLRALGPGREQPAGLSFPGRAVDHGLAVGGEARREDRPAAEGEPLEGREPVARRVPGGGRRLARAGGLAEAPPQHLELAREVLRGGVALLRVLREAALDHPAQRGGQPRRGLERAARGPRG